MAVVKVYNEDTKQWEPDGQPERHDKALEHARNLRRGGLKAKASLV